MKLKSFNYFYCLLIIFLNFAPLKAEEKIDIWNNKDKKKSIENSEQIKKEKSQKLNLESIKTIELNKKNVKFKSISNDKKVSKVSIIGAGMITTPGVTYKMFRALAQEKINILAISTSEIKISVIINEINTIKAVKKLHTVFNLD